MCDVSVLVCWVRLAWLTYNWWLAIKLKVLVALTNAQLEALKGCNCYTFCIQAEEPMGNHVVYLAQVWKVVGLNLLLNQYILTPPVAHKFGWPYYSRSWYPWFRLFEDQKTEKPANTEERGKNQFRTNIGLYCRFWYLKAHIWNLSRQTCMIFSLKLILFLSSRTKIYGLYKESLWIYHVINEACTKPEKKIP